MMHNRLAPEFYLLVNFGCSKDRAINFQLVFSAYEFLTLNLISLELACCGSDSFYRIL